MQQWQSGYRLKNRPYKIERVLGEGGFGITYKAQHLILDIPVVIKTPNSRLKRDVNYSKYLQDFKKEGKQLAKLGLNPHPHIVRVSDLFVEDNLPCIVMDFIPGKSLYDLVVDNGKLSEVKALEYIKQIGSALIVCHNSGIIHRDAHPNNILIRNDNGKAVLIDFGIAGNTQTSRNTHSGNRAFAPWEQIASWEESNSKTPQVDIYTLAASLYYMVTGEIPRECLARKYNNRELEPPQQLNPRLSARVNQGILKGMEILPQNRPNSMQEWLDLLFAVPKKPEDRKIRERRAAKTSKEIPTTSPEIAVLKKPEDRKIRVVQPVVIPQTPKNQTSAPRREQNNPPTITVTRRRWLGYAGLTLGTIGVTLIGKSILDNAAQQTGEKDVPLDSPKVTKEPTPNLTEYKFDVITVNDRGEEIEREQGKAEYFTEDLGSRVTMDMVAIPGGTFMMGSPESEKGSQDDEIPQHQVTVPAFYMGKFQVTQEQWKAVAELPQIARELKPDPSGFKGNKLLVEKVSWYDAVEFCARLSKATGKEYRLPSEAEWEYACRSGRTTPFHFGATITSDLANYNGNKTYAKETTGEKRGKTTPVGSFPPNGFGLYDMHGNVWEWCGDSWNENYLGAPNDGRAWIEGNDTKKVLRGGSWNYNPWDCRSANRLWSAPDNLGSDLGFRCVAVI